MKARLATAAAAAVAVVAALLAWWHFGPGSTAQPASAAAVSQAQAFPWAQAGTSPAALEGPKVFAQPSPTPAGAPLTAAERERRRAQLQQRLARAEQALGNYEQTARYPHESRPASEHPDQLYPFLPVQEDRPLRAVGGTSAQGVRLRTTQERSFLSGNEASRITLALVDDQGRSVQSSLPLVITRAVLAEVTPPGRTSSTVPLPAAVNDAGLAGDAAAGDGIFSFTVQPAAQGFANFSGLLRLTLDLQAGGQPGFLYFDFIYSPGEAARWLPGVREALEQGSLALYMKAQVLQPGRYVVSARVDDASGKTVALALFNQELPAGEQAIRLQVFGKLLRDAQPSLPLRLRDVDAFLLKPDTYPDRITLPRLAGVVHTTRVYGLNEFSDALWSSEERERYLRELGRDVQDVKDQLRSLGP